MESLYFIAVVPPRDIRDEITDIKNHIATHFNSNHALRSPPHITLHMPFKVNERKKEKLVQTLKEEIAGHNPFRVELKNFDCFAPRVIFVRVLPNEKLMSLQRQIAKIMWTQNIFNGNYKDRAFHPHLTVAFRDLKKSDFHRAWDHFKSQELQFAFSVDQIELLKHGGKKWQIDESINF